MIPSLFFLHSKNRFSNIHHINKAKTYKKKKLLIYVSLLMKIFLKNKEFYFKTIPKKKTNTVWISTPKKKEPIKIKKRNISTFLNYSEIHPKKSTYCYVRLDFNTGKAKNL